MSQTVAGLMVELGVNAGAFMDGMDRATYKSKQAARDIGNSFKNMGREITDVLGELGGGVGETIGKIFEGTGEALAKISKEMGSISGPAGAAAVGIAAVAAAAVAATTAIVILSAKTAEANAKLFHMAEATGVSFGSLQRFDAAAKIAGVNSDGMALGLERMSKSALLAAQSGNYSSTSWGRLGINVRDAGGHLKSTTDLMTEVSNKFASMSDGSEKTARAMEIFGRAGATLIPFLNLGGPKLKEFGDYAERVGAVLDDAGGRSAVRFEEAMGKLDLAMAGIQNRLSVGVVDALEKLVNAFADADHEGTLFTQTGQIVGTVLIDITEAVYGLIGGLRDLGLEYDKTAAIFNLSLSFNPLKWGGEWDEMVAKLKGFNDQQLQIEANWNKFVSKMNEKPELFNSLVRDFIPKTGTSNTAPKESQIAPVTDIAGEMEAKLAGQIANTIALAGGRNTLSASTTLLNAEEKTRNEILDKQLTLSDELKIKQQELVNLKAPGSDATDKQISAVEQRIQQIQKLKATLETETPKIIEMTQQLAAQTQAKSTGATVDEFLNTKTRSANLAVKSAAAPAEGPAEELSGQIDKTVEKQTEDLQVANDTVTELIAKYPNLAAAMAPYVAMLHQKNEELQKSRGEIGIDIVASEIGKTSAQFAKQNDLVQDQINSAVRLADAYKVGGKALEDAQIAQQLQADQQNVDDLSAKLKAAGPMSPENAAELQILADKLALANGQLTDHAKLLAELKTANLGETLAADTMRLQAQAAAFEIVSKAALSSAAAQREAAATAAAKTFGVEHPEATPQDVKTVHDNTLSQENQKYVAKVRETEAQANLNKKFQDEVQLLSDATALAVERNADSATMAQLNGELTKTQQEYQKSLDETAEKYGTLENATKGFFDEITSEGQNAQGSFFATLKTGFDGLEESMAKFIVTGRGGFLGIIQSMETALVKLGIQFALTAAKAEIFQALGINAGGAGTSGIGAIGATGATGATGGVSGVLKGILGIFGQKSQGSGTGDQGTLPLATSGVTSSVYGAGSGAAGAGSSGAAGGASSVIALAANTAAMVTHTAATTAQTTATSLHIGALTINTGAIFAHIGVMFTHIGVMLVHLGATLALVAATIANTLAIIWNTIINTIKLLFPFLAEGGDTASNGMYVIGEKGPELFSPGAGHVYPNSVLQGMMHTKAPGSDYMSSDRAAAVSPATGNVARGSNSQAGSTTAPGHTVNVNHNISMIDATGFSDLLEKHSRVVANHVDKALRQSNQRIA